MKKICHITTGVNIGGAEMFLLNLSVKLKSEGYQQTIISLLGEGDLSKKFSDEKIELIHLNLSRYPWTWWRLFKLPSLLRKESSDIIQTWLYHADIVGGIASLFVKSDLIWNVRQTDISTKNNKKEIILLARFAAYLSNYLPKKIICCSEKAKDSHIQLGYDEHKIVVIPNGCDTTVYSRKPQERKTIRGSLNIGENDIVVGRFGRFDIQKDYRNFVAAAELILSNNKNVWFLMAGENITNKNYELQSWISATGNADRFILLGKRQDLPELYQAIDIMVSSSLGEGFPNVVAEAMACEIPCVVTDVGESGRLVGLTGLIVPKEDKNKLAKACMELINLESEQRGRLGAEARARIVEDFSIERSTSEYSQLYSSALRK